jgi:hypothetical protein
MFVELLPLLAKRSLAITMSATSATDVHLSIQPIPTDKTEKVPDPYEASGPAIEVDARFVADIAGYTKTVLAFYSTLEDVKASTEATLKEVKAESDKKIADARKVGKVAGSVVKPTPAPAKPEPVKAPEPPSLFDAVPAQAVAAPQVAPVVSVEAPVVAVATSDSEEDDIDPDDDPSGSDDDEETSEDVSEDVPDASHVPVMTPAVIQDSHSSMFATQTSLPAFDEEEALLKEAFDGPQNQLIAA